MSKYSGKYDLCDHIFMQKMYPVYPGNPNSSLTSDEMECFLIFKQRTGGKIYQHIPLELNEFNIDHEIEVVNNPAHLSKREVPWEDGKKHKTKKYIYTYWGKDYKTLRGINKRQYYSIKEIRFETLLDIIPYYPHIISMSSSSSESEHVVISSDSFVERQYEGGRAFGHESLMYDYYKRELQNHYIEVVREYFLQDGGVSHK